MSDTIALDPTAMDEVAADLDLRADDLDEVANDLTSALDAYVASSAEFVPALPAHAAVIGTQGDALRGLATGVLNLAEAAREADAQGIDLRRALASGAHLIGGASTATGTHSAIQRLLRLAVHGQRDVRGALGQLRLTRRYGPRAMPDIAAIRREITGGHAMNRRAIRPLQVQRYRELKVERRQLARSRTAARSGTRTNRPLTGLGQRVDDLLTTTRVGRGLHQAGRGLGAAGVLLSLGGALGSAREGDAEGAVVNGLATAGGALMLSGNPVTMGLGAAITVGVVVYDNWDTITDVAGDVKDFGSSVVSGAADLVGGLF